MTFKDLRRKAGLDAVEAASALGVTVHTIYKIEEGRRKPSLKLIRRMCNTYKTNIEEIFKLL
jgi:DNA-binding XRE family transcriptional regulator